jgi:hypothetical protein
MKDRKQLDERLARLPKELREPPVALAAISLIGPLFLVLLGLAAGQSEVSSPLYTLASIVFVVALVGFIVTSIRHFKVVRAAEERFEAERIRARSARRSSTFRTSRSRAAAEEARADARRAS